MKKRSWNLRRGLLPFTLALIILFSMALPAAAENDFESIAQSAFLMEASTGKILYEKNADISMPPASITKIMTLLISFEALENGDVTWDTPVTISEKAWRMEGSRMFLEVGTQVPFGEIISGISIVSANDGCVAVAEHLFGTTDAFVQHMNKRAKELGLTKSQFKNTNGLPEEGHYMSARDIGVLAQYLITHYPKILEFEATKEFTYNGILQYNRNPLLGVYPGADGLKTGWTNEAGYCLVGTAKQNDMRLVTVVLNTKDDDERLAASSELLNYGFRNFEIYEVVKGGTTVEEANVKNGKEMTVPVKINNDITAVIPTEKKSDITISVKLDKEPLTAPVKADTKVGSAEIRLGDEVLATTEVITANDVEKLGFFEGLFHSIANFFKSLFKVSRE